MWYPKCSSNQHVAKWLGSILLSLCCVLPTAYAQESVATYNQFVLPTDTLTGGETCTGPDANNTNIFITAKNKGWLYAGFLYSAFLTSLDQYSASHGNASPFTWHDNTPINTSDLFTLSACDYSYCVLQKIFGQMPGLFYANGSPECPETNNIGPLAISNLLRLFNIGIFSVVCVMVAYGLIGKGVLIGGFEGDILQRNFTFSTASRIAVAMFSIIPMPGIGYSAMQSFMMYVVLLGVGFADSTFRVGLNAYLDYGSAFSFAGYKSSSSDQQTVTMDYTRPNVQSLFLTGSAKYASLMNMINCAYYTVVQDKVSQYTPYDTGQENYALTATLTSASSVQFSDVINIDSSNPTTTTINFGNYSTDTPPETPQCGAISWNGSGFVGSPADYMLQALFNETANIFFNSNQFFLYGLKNQTEIDYATCLQGQNIQQEGLVAYTDIQGNRGYKDLPI